jgi:dihydrofolate reductase
MDGFMTSVDTKVLGRETYEVSLRMGAKFDSRSRTIVFSRQPPPADAPSGAEFEITVVPMFIGEGIPLIARRRRQVPLESRTVERFEDGLVQLHDGVGNSRS